MLLTVTSLHQALGDLWVAVFTVRRLKLLCDKVLSCRYCGTACSIRARCEHGTSLRM